jgi:hypothetical protein
MLASPNKIIHPVCSQVVHPAIPAKNGFQRRNSASQRQKLSKEASDAAT